MSLMVATVAGLVFSKNLLLSTLLGSAVSCMAAVTYMLFHAVDVALTEAAVGAGLSGILIFMTVAATKEEVRCISNVYSAAFVVIVLGWACFWIFAHFPFLQDKELLLHSHIAEYFQTHALLETGSNNMVTAILASYRGYDTLGEVCVIFTAGLSVFLLLRKQDPKKHNSPSRSSPIENLLLRQLARLLVPLVLIYGCYILLFGNWVPGGGFQSGVILASGIILYALVYGVHKAQKLISWRTAEKLMAAGILLYATTGFATLLLGGEFLNYSVLRASQIDGQSLGIFVIEIGISITIVGTVTLLYYLLDSRIRKPDAANTKA